MRDRSRSCAGVGAGARAGSRRSCRRAMLAQSASPAASGFPKPLLPTIDLSAVGGPGEGELNIIVWVGYAEDGSNLPEYDWVHGFQDATGCQVNVKIDDTSDQMVTDMRTGAYDGVSASGDATLRLIAGGRRRRDRHQPRSRASATWRRSSRTHRTTSWTASTTACPTAGAATASCTTRTKVTPAPTSWDVVFDPAKEAATYSGLITAYDSPIYIADAALYLKSHSRSWASPMSTS